MALNRMRSLQLDHNLPLYTKYDVPHYNHAISAWSNSNINRNTEIVVDPFDDYIGFTETNPGEEEDDDDNNNNNIKEEGEEGNNYEGIDEEGEEGNNYEGIYENAQGNFNNNEADDDDRESAAGRNQEAGMQGNTGGQHIEEIMEIQHQNIADYDEGQNSQVAEATEVNQEEIWNELQNDMERDNNLYTIHNLTSHFIQQNNSLQRLQAGTTIITNNIATTQTNRQLTLPSSPPPTNIYGITIPPILTTPTILQIIQQDTNSEEDYIDDEPLSIDEVVDWLGEESRSWIQEVMETQNINTINLHHLEEMYLNYAMQQSWDEEPERIIDLPEIDTTNIIREFYYQDWANITNPIKDAVMNYTGRTRLESETIYDTLMLMAGNSDSQEIRDFWETFGRNSESSRNSEISDTDDEITAWFLDFENTALKINLQALTTRFKEDELVLRLNKVTSIPSLRTGVWFKQGQFWIAASFKSTQGEIHRFLGQITKEIWRNFWSGKDNELSIIEMEGVNLFGRFWESFINQMDGFGVGGEGWIEESPNQSNEINRSAGRGLTQSGSLLLTRPNNIENDARNHGLGKKGKGAIWKKVLTQGKKGQIGKRLGCKSRETKFQILVWESCI